MTGPEKEWPLRRARESDAAALADCMAAAYSVYLDRLDGESLPPMTADYLEEIRSSSVWIAESAGEVAGALILVPEPDAGFLTIANVAVHPGFQGRGLGKVFMTKAEAEARASGCHTLRLATHVLLTENLSMYAHLGWTEIDRDSVRVRMEKKLI